MAGTGGREAGVCLRWSGQQGVLKSRSVPHSIPPPTMDAQGNQDVQTMGPCAQMNTNIGGVVKAHQPAVTASASFGASSFSSSNTGEFLSDERAPCFYDCSTSAGRQFAVEHTMVATAFAHPSQPQHAAQCSPTCPAGVVGQKCFPGRTSQAAMQRLQCTPHLTRSSMTASALHKIAALSCKHGPAVRQACPLHSARARKDWRRAALRAPAAPAAAQAP